ncbi:MAG: RICIN domain-containing protein [Candidatus Rokuibacteriota bacterium]
MTMRSVLALLTVCGILLAALPQTAHAQPVQRLQPQPLPSGTFNRLPLRATSVFDTQFDVSTAGPNPVNSYLATYLATLVYPEFLDQLSGSPFRQNEPYAKSLHTNPASFYSEYRKYTAYLFANPAYTWIYSDQGGYNPEAMVISSPKAVVVVFRGTDRVGAAKTKAGYDWAEWVFSDFYAIHETPDLAPLAGQVHKGFWDSLKARPKVIRQGGQGPAPGQCLQSSRGESSFRECLVSEIRAAAGSSKRVFLVGHSLGAAHAQVFAAYLAGHLTSGSQSDAIKPQAVYAIAAPHPGNDAFRDRLNALLGKGRLQRFDFVNDPITMLPPYLLGPYQYGRAGTRTYYDDIKTVQVSVRERVPAIGEPLVTNFVGGVLAGGILGGGAVVFSDFCFHYPQWYLNAAWSGVPRQARSQLPVPLPVPNVGGSGGVYGGCVNPVTVARGERSELGRAADAAKAAQEAAAAAAKAAEEVVYNAGQLFANLIANPVADGVYYLRLLEGRKYLDISGGCRGQNGCKVQLWSIGESTANNRFRIKKVTGGYTIQNGSGDNIDFLEVDGNDLLDDPGRIQMWEANLPFGGHNANQLWHFYQVPNRAGLFVIRNVATSKVMDAVNNCVNQNGCEIRQRSARNNDPTQVWILQRP